MTLTTIPPMTQQLELEIRSLAALNTAQLREQLAASLQLTAAHIVRLAAIVRLLEDRGEDLSDIRISILGWVRRVAHGQLLPEIMVRFQGSPLLLNRIANLPLPDQRRITDGEPLKIACMEDGTVGHRLVDPLRMSMGEISLVFAKDHIRDETEQLAWMRSRAVKPGRRRERVELDYSRGGIVVSGKSVFLSIAELRQHLEQLEIVEAQSHRRRPAGSIEMIPLELRRAVEEDWVRFPRVGRRDFTLAEKALLGTAPDRVVGEFLDRTSQTIRNHRIAVGIPRYGTDKVSTRQ